MSDALIDLVIICAMSNQPGALELLIKKHPNVLEEIDHDELCREAHKLGYLEVANILTFT